jgi:hypothetical protein
MKKVLFAALLTIIIIQGVKAQAPQLNVELFGPSVIGFNYDTRFTKSEKGIGGRVGIGGITLNKTGYFFLPVGINYLMGKDDKNDFFEVGAGFTYASYILNGAEGDPKNDLSDLWGHLNFGYRYQPKGSGFTYRIAINPVIDIRGGTFWPIYGGISIGYKLK